MRHLAPLARANSGACAALANGLAGKRAGSRAIGELCRAWKMADPDGRRKIEENPLLYLRMLKEAGRPAPLDVGEEGRERLLRELEGLSSLCCRLRRKVRESSADLRHPGFRQLPERLSRNLPVEAPRWLSRSPGRTPRHSGAGSRDGWAAFFSSVFYAVEVESIMHCLSLESAKKALYCNLLDIKIPHSKITV